MNSTYVKIFEFFPQSTTRSGHKIVLSHDTSTFYNRFRRKIKEKFNLKTLQLWYRLALTVFIARPRITLDHFNTHVPK